METYKAFAEHEIPLARHTGREALVYREDESVPGARGKRVWSHASISGKSKGCSVVNSAHRDLYYCTHESHRTFGQRTPCAHLSNLLWHMAFDEARAIFDKMTDAELFEQDRHFAMVAAGKLVKTRGWDAQYLALGEVIESRDTMMEAA